MDSQAPTLAPAPHVVDVLIAERAPRLTGSAVWPLARPGLYALLGYGRARAMADAIAPLSGQAALDHVAALLALKVKVAGQDRIPETGACVIVSNHPTGIADGLALHEAVRRRRGDDVFFANADALRVSPRLGEVVIPVEWVHDKRTREKTRATLAAARAAMEARRALVMFPAGRLGRAGPHGRVVDPEWAPTAVSLARRHGAPVVPVHMTGPYSRLFHLFDRVSQELRDVTLFHEMLNKAGGEFRLTVGRPIPPDRLDADAAAATLKLKAFVEDVLPRDPQAEFT